MHGNESRKFRKTKLLPAWAGQDLSVMEMRVDSQVRSFLDLIERKYISTPQGGVKPMDFGHRAQFHTLDVVTSATVKERLNPGDENLEHDLIRAYLRNGVEPEDGMLEYITLV